jgi:hypothetical protein
MDKTLEVILVAVVLVVAAVIVVGLLQGRAAGLGGFADNKTTSASCGLASSNFRSAVDCSGCSGTSCTVDSDRASDIYNENSGCFDGSSKGAVKAGVCN